MNTLSLTPAVLLAFTTPIFASGTHTSGHDKVELAVGAPSATRDVSTMRETDDGDMIFEPAILDIQTGETIRFMGGNTGELDHAFVLDTVEESIRC